MSDGWVKIHRKLLENPRFRDGDWLKVWLWMLLRASHGGHSVIFKGERIQLQAGQFTAGRFQISEQTGVNQSKVFRVLEALKSEQQIEQRISNACSLFTITNWTSYQKIEQQIEQPTNNQRTTNEQPANTKQECKNVRSTVVIDDDWMAELQVQEIFQGVNVKGEFQKMVNWCNLNRKQPTRRRFLGWLNRADKPMQTKGAASGGYSEAELTLIAMGKR